MRGTNHTKKVYEYNIDRDGFEVLWTEPKVPVKAEVTSEKLKVFAEAPESPEETDPPGCPTT